MPASFLSLPVELIESIVAECPRLILNLRLTCRDMDNKTTRLFANHHLQDVCVAVTEKSMSILLRITQNQRLGAAIKKLRFAMTQWEEMSHELVTSGAFEIQLQTAMERMPNCKSCVFDCSTPLGREGGPACEVQPYISRLWEEYDEPTYVDIARMFLAMLHAVVASSARVEEIIINGETSCVLDLEHMRDMMTSAAYDETSIPSIKTLKVAIEPWISGRFDTDSSNEDPETHKASERMISTRRLERGMPNHDSSTQKLKQPDRGPADADKQLFH